MVLHRGPDRRNARIVVEFMCSKQRRREAMRAATSITSDIDINSPVGLS